jgi:hypothetical protein
MLTPAAPPLMSHSACNVCTAPLWQPTATLSPAQLTLKMGQGARKKAVSTFPPPSAFTTAPRVS